MAFGRDVLPPFSCLNGLDLADTEMTERKKWLGYASGFANPRKPTYITILKMEAHFLPNSDINL
jgi:hypothetical protein